MTTISFRRTGGLMGRELAANFDLEELPDDMSQHLHNLINETKFFATPVSHEAMSGPDEFEYTVSIEAGQSMHTVRATDTSMPESLRPLIEQLMEMAKETGQ
jgi:hypothetical protein